MSTLECKLRRNSFCKLTKFLSPRQELNPCTFWMSTLECELRRNSFCKLTKYFRLWRNWTRKKRKSCQFLTEAPIYTLSLSDHTIFNNMKEIVFANSQNFLVPDRNWTHALSECQHLNANWEEIVFVNSQNILDLDGNWLTRRKRKSCQFLTKAPYTRSLPSSDLTFFNNNMKEIVFVNSQNMHLLNVNA